MYYSDLLNDNLLFNIEKTTYSGNVSMNSSHYHSHYEILYIEQGTRSITINEVTKHTIDKGCIVLIPPNIIHSTQSASKNQTRILINISPSLIDDIISFTSKNAITCFDSIILPLRESDVKTVKYYLDTLEKNNSEHIAFKDDICKSLLCSFLMELSSIYHNLYNSGELVFSKPSDSVEKAMDFISQHYYEDITLSDLAKAASLSKDHLIRIFAEKYNVTPIKFLNIFRVITAKRFLESGTMSISDVARACGYNSNTSFTRIFKQITLDTPKEYQIKFRQKKKK